MTQPNVWGSSQGTAAGLNHLDTFLSHFGPFFYMAKRRRGVELNFARDLCHHPSIVENAFRVEVSFKEKHTQQKKQKIHHKRHSILIPRLLKPRVFFKNIYCKTHKKILLRWFGHRVIGSPVSCKSFDFFKTSIPNTTFCRQSAWGSRRRTPKDDFENPLRRCREKRDLKVLKVLLFSWGNRKK